MEFLDMLLHRRSVRKYEKGKIDKKLIEKILYAGLLAPTSRNSRCFEFVLVEDEQMLKKLSNCKENASKMLEGAGAAIVVIGDEEKSSVWVEDCSIAMTTMHIMADSLGLGSCWIQIRKRLSQDENISAGDYCKKLLEIPDNKEVEAILSLGNIKNHPKMHSLEELEMEKIHYEKY